MVNFGSIHLSPFGPASREADSYQAIRAIYAGNCPGLLGGDFNSAAADPSYDPDPYTATVWHHNHAFQHAADGTLDRAAAHVLETCGRLQDCARLAGAAWQPTTGHFPADEHPPRRIDRIYATSGFPPEAIISARVIDTSRTRACSDHLPVVVQLDPAVLISGR